MRMKHAMSSIVDDKRLTMFRQSTDEVRTRLARMVVALEETMSNKADEVHLMLRRDYSAVLGGPEIPSGEMMPKWQRDLRRDVLAVVEGSESAFKRLAGVEEGAEDEGEGEEAGFGDGGVGDEKLLEDDDELMFRGGVVESEDGAGGDHAMDAETKDVKMDASSSLQPRAPPSTSASTAPALSQPALIFQGKEASKGETVEPGSTHNHAVAPTTTADTPPTADGYSNESFHPNAWTNDDGEEDEDDEGVISVDSCGVPRGFTPVDNTEVWDEGWEGYGDGRRRGWGRKHDMSEVEEDEWSGTEGSGVEEEEEGEEMEEGMGEEEDGGVEGAGAL